MTDEEKYKVADKVKDALGDLIVSIEQPRPNRIYVVIHQDNFPEAVRIVYEQLGGRLATSTALEVRDAVELIYHLMLPEDKVLCNVKTLAAKPELKVGSCANFFPATDWIEREMSEMYGVTFEGHPDPRHLLLPDGWPEGNFPYRCDYPQKPDAFGEELPDVYQKDRE